MGFYEVPVIQGYSIGVYSGNLVISHNGDTMVVEAFSKPKSWTPFKDIMDSMSHNDNAVIIGDGTMRINDVIIEGIDDVSWFSRAYITTRHGGDGLQRYYHLIRINRGDKPMAPLTRLKAIEEKDATRNDTDELDELGNTVLSSFIGDVNQNKITIRAS
jgi:hypothetical protein